MTSEHWRLGTAFCSGMALGCVSGFEAALTHGFPALAACMAVWVVSAAFCARMVPRG